MSPPGPLTFHQGPALAAFLQANARADTTLVLAGDIVDFLHVDDRPPVLDMPGHARGTAARRAPARARASPERPQGV